MASNENGTNTKKRSPNKCREWERERRNRFNDAISQLGELVKQTIKKFCNDDDEQTAQFPKIEIIQKAIIFIKEFIEEKSQLKSEILALQVKLDSEVKQKVNRKDASTQISKECNTKVKNTKCNKLVVMKKCKQNPLNDVKNTTKPDNINLHDEVSNKFTCNPQNLPMLLPKSIINGKRPSENTIVVLPAPYVIPPRPFLFPAAPSAFVLLDHTPQSSNCKTSIPVVTRNGNEVTKTTMVNIVPISAYSHPLSLNKTKKNSSKSRNENIKRKVKQPKNVKKSLTTNNDSDNKKFDHNISEKKVENEIVKSNDDNKLEKEMLEYSIPSNSKDITAATSEDNTSDKDALNTALTSHDKDLNHKLSGECKSQNIKDISIQKPNINSNNKKNIIITENEVSCTSKINDNLHTTIKACENDIVTEKITSDIKQKDNLSPTLERTLCENAVDNGNARLELAEEFLAASPTAAFLMSFPLVSGNRADSPAEEVNTTQTASSREPSSANRHTEPSNRTTCVETPQPDLFYTKTSQIEVKCKSNNKLHNSSKDNNNMNQVKDRSNNKSAIFKDLSASAATVEHPFVSLPAPTMVSTNCTMADTTFSLDFDCNLNKSSIPNHTSSYVNNNTFFFNKNDAFNPVKNTIYSSSSIGSSHDYNSISLYPCAMEKYSTKNKADYPNVEENLMKIGSSRLTYDIDLGWPHKSFDFVTCSNNSNTFNKDNIFTTASAPFSTFNPDFHVNLGSSSNKKDATIKTPSNHTDAITNFYSQPPNLWSDELPFYGNNNVTAKPPMSKQQSFVGAEQTHQNSKQNTIKNFDTKINQQNSGSKNSNQINNLVQHVSDKYSKKSPNKMHINWMTSETRPIQNNNCTTSIIDKDSFKSSYGHHNQSVLKKQDHNESNFFPIPINNLPTQSTQDDFHVWPSSRPLGTTEISIEPPPINLPTLVGDLALGPHDKKKNDNVNRVASAGTELNNCNSFLSVTQLMNRSSENVPSRYQVNNTDGAVKSNMSKQNMNQYVNDNTRKVSVPRLDANYVQSYVFDDKGNSFDGMTQFSNTKSKVNKSSSEKMSKSHKNNYSAEALLRGGTQKTEQSKFAVPTQKYNNFNSSHDGSVAQVSHFPPILDYSENSYASQQLGTSHLYSSTTSTISNSFYTNFMPTSSNLMSSNYTGGNFSGDFMDYNQGVECNYTNPKYEEFKMRNNATVFPHDKVPSSNYRNTRRESSTKHKLECSKKDTTKKYPSKKPKVHNNEVEEWSDTSHLLWQNRTPNKKHGNLVSDELSFPNFTANTTVPGQYQPEFFNSHLMPANVQGMGHNMDRSIPSFPGTSRANFNLSTIFPEITMKVQ